MPTPQPIRFQDIYIAQPCSAHWQDMDATSSGAYCRNCKKVVIDYTQMSEAELNAHFAAGEATGCGRFYVSLIGRPPIVQAPTPARMMLERWRTGAAAALLFLSLWQLPKVGKAEPRRVSYAGAPILAPDLPMSTTDSSLQVAAVLLSYEGQNIPVDFGVKLILPSGEEIPVQTRGGFFTLDLQNRVLPSDSVTLMIPQQAVLVNGEEAEFVEETYRISVQNMRNLSLKTAFSVPVPVISSSLVMGSMEAKPLSASVMTLTPRTIPFEREVEPLFRTKTPEEKALAKANREAKRAERESD